MDDTRDDDAIVLPIDGVLDLHTFDPKDVKDLVPEYIGECLRREIKEELGVEIVIAGSLGVYRHAYTHFRITLYAFACELGEGVEPQPLLVNDLRWVEPLQLSDYPMGKIDRRIALEIMRKDDC